MAETGFGDYFIRDLDDESLENEAVQVPVVVPQQAQQPVPAPQAAPAAPQVQAPQQPAPQPVQVPQQQVAPQPVPQPVQPQPLPQPQPVQVAPAPVAQQPAPAQREDQLGRTLDALLSGSPDIQAAALVSLDGFIIASALPRGMQEDRVGAMSAAILGLGERAALELGRGDLSQVFIEGADGYVLLLSAGNRAVLTVLASKDAKLGLVLYDMKSAASRIGEILR